MKIQDALRYIAVAVLFLIPFIVFIVATTLFFPYITGKNFMFRLLVEIAGGAWLALALLQSEFRPKRSLVLYAFTAFVVAIGIADTIGVNPAKSLWSNYERMDGWVTLAHLFVFFLVTSSLFTKEIWKRWWQTSVGVSAIVGLHGLTQMLGIAAISTQSGMRVDGTFGNATYFGVYMLFHIFISAFLLAEEWRTKPHGGRAWVTGIYGSIMTLAAITLFFSGTRGAILGLIGGAALASVLFILRTGSSRLLRYLAIGIGILTLVSGFIWTQKDTEWVHRIDPLYRLAHMSFTERTIISRFMNAGMAFEGFKERPILGWGQENYALVFDKHYNPEMYAQEPWFDRVHNVIFDWLIAGGIIGLLTYLSIYATSLWALWRGTAFSKLDQSILTGLLAGYFFYLLFTFDNITSYILFAAVVAYITTRTSEQSPSISTHALVPYKAASLVALSALVVVGVSAWGVNGAAYAANKALIQGLSPQKAGIAANLEYFKKALSYNSYGTQEVREHLSQTAAQVGGMSEAPAEIKKQFYDLAITEMQKQSDDVPQSARFPFFLGILKDSFRDHEGARVALEKAHENSPGKQAIAFQLAMNAIARGDTGYATQLLEHAYQAAPEYEESATLYALALVSAGRFDDAEPIVAKIADGKSSPDQRLLAAYVSQGRYDKVARLMTLYIAQHPDDAKARVTEAAALYAGGDKDAAVKSLEATQKAIPQSAAAAASLIQQVKAGTWNVK